MLIRHDPHLSRGRLLMPIPKHEWVAPSISLPRDQLGNEVVRTYFRLRARLDDGHVVWEGWFDDRDDADAFLFSLVSGSLRYERDLWRMPTPEWHPDISTDLFYDFATVVTLTTAGSNQTYTSPSDWNNSSNTVHCIGGGAGGGGSTGGSGTGGGGGAYSRIANFSFATPGTTTATYRVGGGATGGAGVAGTSGNPTWFNNATDPGNGSDNTKCSAAAGVGGVVGAAPQNGGAGGATTSGWGQTKFAGGRGGNITGSTAAATGGGGAAGSSGAGGDGVDTAAGSGTAGGSANGGATAGGAGSTTTATAGSNGTEFGTVGSGSGGGGGRANAGNGVGGAGGNYGGGGGGGRGATSGTGGAGIQGLIALEYYVPAPSLLWNPRQAVQHLLVR